MPKQKTKKRGGTRKAQRAARNLPKPTAQVKEEVKEAEPTAAKETDTKSATPSMDRRSQLIVVSLMGLMLFFFLLIALFAPDPVSPSGKPPAGTVFWRLVFLLIPLGVMYGLLWWKRILNYIRP